MKKEPLLQCLFRFQQRVTQIARSEGLDTPFQILYREYSQVPAGWLVMSLLV